MSYPTPTTEPTPTTPTTEPAPIPSTDAPPPATTTPSDTVPCESAAECADRAVSDFHPAMTVPVSSAPPTSSIGEPAGCCEYSLGDDYPPPATDAVIGVDVRPIYELPDTGAGSSALAGVALALVVLGAGVMRVARR